MLLKLQKNREFPPPSAKNPPETRRCILPGTSSPFHPMPSDPQHGDRASDFIPLITGSQRELRNYLFSLHPHPGDLDDLFQETSLKLWEIFDEYDASRPFLPWALRIAYFQVLRFRKKRSRDRLVFSDDELYSMHI